MNTDPNIVCSIKSCNFRTFHAGAQGLRKLHSFQGQSNEIFDPHLFTPFEPAWATDQRVSSSYSNFSESPLGIILRRVNLHAVLYRRESCDFQDPI